MAQRIGRGIAGWRSRGFSRWSRFVFLPGVRSSSSELDRVNPGSAGSEFGLRNGSRLVRQVRSSEKGPGRTLVWLVRSSEKGPFLSPNSEPARVRSLEKGPGRTLVREVRSSEKGLLLSPNSEPWNVRSSEKGPGRTVRQVRSSEKGTGPASISFLAHLSRRLIDELIGYPWSGVRRLSSVVRPQFQMSSPLKPLGQLKPNFMCSLLCKGERKFI